MKIVATISAKNDRYLLKYEDPCVILARYISDSSYNETSDYFQNLRNKYINAVCTNTKCYFSVTVKGEHVGVEKEMTFSAGIILSDYSEVLFSVEEVYDEEAETEKFKNSLGFFKR